MHNFGETLVLEFTESITPDRVKYRYHYMTADCDLIFRYDNVPHHSEIPTFPDHKHFPGKIVESSSINIKKVVEEIIELLVS